MRTLAKRPVVEIAFPSVKASMEMFSSLIKSLGSGQEKKLPGMAL
jgi:hypothetical protein